MRKKTGRYLFMFLALVMCFSSPALADLLGPGWDVPGSFTSVTSDPTYQDMGRDGGLWLTYSGFDTTQFTSLYYGPSNTDGYIPGLAMDGNINNLGDYSGTSLTEQLTSFTTGTVARGYGTTEYKNISDGLTYLSSTRMELFIYDLSDTQIVWGSDTILPTPMFGAVADVYDAILYTGGFKVNIRNYAHSRPLLDYYDSHHTGSYDAQMSYNDGFWHEPTSATVPEPTTMLLFGTGLIGLVGIRRKFKR